MCAFELKGKRRGHCSQVLKNDAFDQLFLILFQLCIALSGLCWLGIFDHLHQTLRHTFQREGASIPKLNCQRSRHRFQVLIDYTSCQLLFIPFIQHLIHLYIKILGLILGLELASQDRVSALQVLMHQGYAQGVHVDCSNFTLTPENAENIAFRYLCLRI